MRFSLECRRDRPPEDRARRCIAPDYLEPRKWNTVISVSRERNPISLLRRGFVWVPRNKGRCLLSLSLSRNEIEKREEQKGVEADDNFLNSYNLYILFFITHIMEYYGATSDMYYKKNVKLKRQTTIFERNYFTKRIDGLK